MQMCTNPYDEFSLSMMASRCGGACFSPWAIRVQGNFFRALTVGSVPPGCKLASSDSFAVFVDDGVLAHPNRAERVCS